MGEAAPILLAEPCCESQRSMFAVRSHTMRVARSCVHTRGMRSTRFVRDATKETAPAEAKPAASTAPKQVKSEIKRESPSARGGGFRSHLLAFTLGASVAGGAGYYRLEQEIAAAGAASTDAVSALRADLVEAQEKLQARVAALER